MGAKHFGLGKETVYATAAPATTFLEILSEGVKREPRYIPVNTIRSVSPRAQSLGGVVTRGPFRGLINYQDFPSLAYYMLGDVTTSGGGPWSHVIPQTGTPGFIRPSFTTEIQRDVGDGGETHKYQGCVMTELGVVVAVNEICEFSAALVGKGSEVTGSPATPSYPALDLVLPGDCIVKVAPSGSALVSLNAERWTCDISWPVDEPLALGANSIVRKPRDADVMKVSGAFTLLEFDSSVFTLFGTFATADLQLACTGSAGDNLNININAVKLLTGHGQLEGRTTPKPEIRWEAFLDPTTLTPLQINATNDKATLP